jgi:thiol:disulfide interchange protein DsbD
LQIKGKIFAQPCNKSMCLAPTEFPFTASFAGELTAAVPAGVGNGQARPPAGQSESAPPPPGIATAAENRVDRLQGEPPANQTAPATAASTVENPLDKASLIWALGLGFLGGMILNVMPCVLPVIGLKILSFIEQARHDRWQALTLNIWYSLGLLSVFLVLATLSVTIGFGWGQMFTYQGFSIALAAVVFTMALSFLGIWEIPIPGFVGRGVVNELQQKEGASGAFAKGVLTTILATPCSAPFLGSALAWTVKQPPLNTYAVFIMAGLGMASPYLVLGAFPELMRYLPKPGAWMETFKQLMGFVLMATVVFLLSFLKFAYVVPTVALLFGLWGACWWIGRTPPTSALSAQVRAWAEAAAFSAVVWVIAFPGINIFLPGQSGARGGLAGYMETRFERAVEQSKGNLSKTIKDLVDAKKTVLVDFTADWCLSCKAFEHAVLESEAVRKAIDENGIVKLRADWTTGAPDVTEMLERLESKGVPVIAIFGSGGFDHPIVFRGGYTQQQLLDAIQQAGPSKGGEKLDHPGISKL